MLGDAAALGIDATTGQIVAASLTAKEVEDGAEVGALLDQVDGTLATFTADGGYDQDNAYADLAEHHPDANVVVPLRTTAVPSETAETIAQRSPGGRGRALEAGARRRVTCAQGHVPGD